MFNATQPFVDRTQPQLKRWKCKYRMVHLLTDAWAAAAGEHGREVYRDDNNIVDIQLQCLVRLQHLAQREIEAGWQPPAVKFHDFLKC